MFQESELVNLFAALAATVILISVSTRLETAGLRFFLLSFTLMLCAYIATVIEGVLWADFFNIIEHASMALAGLSFLAACRILGRSEKQGKEKES